jgi:hypothetical protein
MNGKISAPIGTDQALIRRAKRQQPLPGTPIRITLREKANPYAGKKRLR